MSNTDFDPNFVPDPANYFAAAQRSAVGQVATSVDDNPDEAARAIELSKPLGLPSTVVHSDLDHYEGQLKANVSSALVANNPYLRDYINSHPLAAKVSNDDYGQLDKVSQALKKIAPGHGYEGSILQAAVKGFKENFDYENTDAEFGQYKDWLASNPLFGNFAIRQAAGAGGAALMLTNQLASGVIGGAASGLGRLYKNLGGSEAWGDRLTRDLIIAAQVGMAEPIATPEGLLHPEARKAIDEAHQFAQAVGPYLHAEKAPPVGVHPLIDEIHVEQAKMDADALSEALKESVKSSTRERAPEMFANYIRGITDGEIGINPDAVRALYGDKVPEPNDGILGFVPDLADKLFLAEATGADVKVPLADYLAHVESEVAKELQDHVRVRPEGVSVEEGKELETSEEIEKISLAALRNMRTGEIFTGRNHGDAFSQAAKVGKAGDVEAGFVTTIGRYVNRDEAVAIAEAANQRRYKGSREMNQQEIEAGTPTGLKTEEIHLSLPENKPTETIRQAAGLQGALLNRVTLRRTSSVEDAAKGRFSFDFLDEKGEPAGGMVLAEEDGGKTLYVDDITSAGGPRSMGSSAMRDLLRQIKEQFPNAERLEGLRVSGAREKAEQVTGKDKAAKELKAGIDLTKVRQPKQLELPQEGTTRIEDRDAFAKASAIGMTADQYKRYQALIEKRAEEDRVAAESRAMAEQRKTQTAEWKANRAELRPQVKADVEARAEVELDQMLRGGKVKLAREGLTDAQISALPREFVSADGIHPDDLAGLFGGDSGSLVDRVVALAQAREASGMKPDAFLRRMVDVETDRQMEVRYGNLDKNILEEAKDQVLSETQEQLLHEETLARASEAGLEYSIGKEELKAAIKGFFDRQRVRDVSSDAALADAGRAGRAAEMALLKGDYAEAFRQKQRQYNAVVMANLARKFEKRQAQFESLAKKYTRLHNKSVEPEYVTWIHDLLARTGQRQRFTRFDLEREVSKGVYKTLSDFVAAKTSELRELHVPEWLQDPKFQGRVEDMTTAEFEEYHDAIKALDHNGRDELKVIRGGEKVDLEATISEMVQAIKSLGVPIDYKIDRPKRRGISTDTAKSYWWSMINLESMFDRLDRGNRKGIFNQTLVREFAEASNSKSATLKDFQNRLAAIGNIPGMNKLVSNDLWFHPHTGQRLVLRKRNVLGMLAYAGNKTSWAKLTGGYGLDPAEAMRWLRMNIEREDIDRMEKIGDMFDELFDRADQMSRRVSGVGIKKLPLEPIDFGNLGTSKGWYNPVKYDPLIPGKSKKLMGPDALEGEGYYRATTNQGYTKERTGYVAPVELNLDIIPVRMRQMIHDIEMRPAVLQLSKIFYNDKFQRAMIDYYGKHQAGAVIPFLRDMANSANFTSMAANYGNEAIEALRQNTIATLIGLNPGTVMKHGPTAAMNSLIEVGPLNFAREFFTLFGHDEVTGNQNWRMAIDKSEELQRRLHQNFSEIITNHEQELAMHKMGWREFMVHAGSLPVAFSDFASAVPTFLAEYKKQKALGEDEGMAVFLGNKAVRHAHGSSVLTHKPEIMRTNALGATFSSLYGFFSQMQQRTYELAWKSRDFYKDTLGSGSGDKETAMRHLPSMMGLMTSLIWSAAVEEIVTPYTNNEKESWGRKAASFLADLTTPGLVVVRDLVRAVLNPRDPQAGLIGTTLKAGTDIAHDLGKGRSIVNKNNAGQFIKHAFTLSGVATGLTNEQEGKLAEFMYDYYTGKTRPKGPWGWLVGARYGTLKGHSPTFERYMRGH